MFHPNSEHFNQYAGTFSPKTAELVWGRGQLLEIDREHPFGSHFLFERIDEFVKV
jgi:hypothetical protein